ncbi:DUF1877 family protein [Streptomyces decoyicus]
MGRGVPLGGRRAPAGHPDAYLDKAWAGLEFLLGKAGEPLEFLMDGYPIDDDGTLVSWSVEDVQAMTKRLGAAVGAGRGRGLRREVRHRPRPRPPALHLHLDPLTWG